MEKGEAFVKICGISKGFGSVKALKDVNLDIYEGEIHTLLGENGAGKSTLINVISGVYTPDEGSITIDGKNASLKSPKDSVELGIGTVYQSFKLIDAMTARENIILGQKISLKKNKEIDLKINEICSKFGIEVDLDKYVMDMSVGEKQNLEILKVLYRGARVLILDEPTTVFTPQETEKLFVMMRKMKKEGCAVLFISHKMDEVMEISDRITVLRKGEFVKSLLKEETNPSELTYLMVGSKVDLSINKTEVQRGKELLNVKDLTVLDDNNVKAVKKISFSLREGEIFGIAGIANSGQKELCEAIAGVRKVKSGEIIFDSENLEGKNPREFVKRGISMGFIPEDRLGMGLVGSMDIVDNLLLKTYYLNNGIMVDRKPAQVRAKEIVKKLNIKTPGINHPVKYLSGGNLQKVLLGRELGLKPRLLVMAYPVRGLDINTCYTIYNLMVEESKKGTSIIFVGEDLDILLQLCDRIMVISRGEVTGIVESNDSSKEKLGLMMMGVKGETKNV